MYASRVLCRSTTTFILASVLCAAPTFARADARADQQEPRHVPRGAANQMHQHPEPTNEPEQQHQHTQHDPDATMFPAREASGTAWLPDTTAMYGIQRRAGSWELMAHGNVFAQLLAESGDRGSDQFGSINWVMVMARRSVAAGRFGLRGMFSLEPWTIGGCGYPDLLATGEVCNGAVIHDRQHPHDLFMELTTEYDRPIRGGLRWRVYGGVAGEPALGPVAYPHRLSATPNPLAPIGHHWLDATHITFGVVTAGLYGNRWKAEASAFNGREPDESRGDINLDALDSLSGRIWFLPTSSLALQFSAGHLNEAEEAADAGAPRVDVDRMTASATYHKMLTGDKLWASTLAWGLNKEEGESTNALLIETSLTSRERHTWFGRFEVGNKPAHDLDVHGDDIFTVAKLQAGFARYFDSWRGLKPGFGGSVSAGFVPRSLEAVYGNRANIGVALFITIRPAAHQM